MNKSLSAVLLLSKEASLEELTMSEKSKNPFKSPDSDYICQYMNDHFETYLNFDKAVASFLVYEYARNIILLKDNNKHVVLNRHLISALFFKCLSK